jgi:hypothetical protein
LVEDCPVSAFVGWQQNLADRYGTDHRVCGLNQSMQLPGFWRRKDPKRPWQARIRRVGSQPAYALAQLGLLLGRDAR